MAVAEHPIAISRTRPGVTTVLHAWVTTVDHKKLGVMYIMSGLVFFVIAGLEATAMRIQLAVPNNDFLSPQVFNRLFTMHGTTHGVPGRHADHHRHGELSHPADDRGARPRVPAPERLRVLDVPVRRAAALLQRVRRRRPLRRRLDARRRLVRLRAAHRARVLARQQHRLLDRRPAGRRRRQPHHRRQPDRHRLHDALPRHDLRPPAAVRVADAGGLLPDAHRPAAALRGAGDAALRPLPRRALLRHPGRRLGGAVAALLLDLRPSRGLHPHAARFRLRLRDHPGVLAQADLRLLDHGRGDACRSASSASACGRTTCSPSA